MNTRRNPAAEPRRGKKHSPLTPLRLALPDQVEERRRAGLYHDLLQRAAIDLPASGSRPDDERMTAAPPLQRGRMVSARVDSHSLLHLLRSILLPSGRNGGNGHE